MIGQKAIEIERFLREVDCTFPIPLSQKQDLHEFAQKLHEKATICAECDGEKIVSMVAGYTEDIIDNTAYISVVSTSTAAQGKGLATNLVKEFIGICAHKNIAAVHLYTDRTNTAAIAMYQKIGFVEWRPIEEKRPDDVHLIYYIGKEESF